MRSIVPDRPPRAYLLDMDGVLVDSTAAQWRGWGIWAAEHGLDPTPYVTTHGLTARDKIAKFAPHLDLDAEAERIAWYETNDRGVQPLPGALEILSRDLPLAVVTSGTRALALHRLTAAALPLPTVLITAESVERGKPDPECYLLAARVLGYRPDECVVIEDAPAGILAARYARMPVVALATTHAPEALDVADTVCTDLRAYLAACPV
jgi:sugar-phosphatase